MCTHLSPVLTVAALIVSDHSLVSGVRGAGGGCGAQPAARPSPERRRGVCKPTSETREECHHVICWVKREYYMSCSCH